MASETAGKLEITEQMKEKLINEIPETVTIGNMTIRFGVNPKLPKGTIVAVDPKTGEIQGAITNIKEEGP